MRASARALLLLLLAASTACARLQQWNVDSEQRVRDDLVADALDDHEGERGVGVDASLAADLPPPAKLRPCCAFGTEMKVRMGALPVPLVALGTVVGPDDLGPHRYDNGLVPAGGGDHRAWVDEERNGVVYTCRGGFVDIAHVRDYADLTLAIFAQLLRRMDGGGSIELPDQGARLRIRVEPVPGAGSASPGRIELALAGAQWLAFQVSIWHEIATWYGFAALEMWPERVSAFSPENLYSNLLGIKLAAGIIRSGGAKSEIDYDLNMDAWIRQALRQLAAVPRTSGVAAMRSVDGSWWDSQVRLPDWRFVRRRNLAVGERIEGWRVEQARGDGAQPPVLAECRDAPSPLALRNPGGFEGTAFRDAFTLEIEVGEAMAERFPFPRADTRVVTQEDLPGIIELIREENAREFGPRADRPADGPAGDGRPSEAASS